LHIYLVIHLAHLYKIPFTVAEEATKEAQPKHQETLSTAWEITSGGKTNSTSIIATKRRLKQEARKNRNICNTPPTS